jgi:hypothetical protein
MNEQGEEPIHGLADYLDSTEVDPDAAFTGTEESGGNPCNVL